MNLKGHKRTVERRRPRRLKKRIYVHIELVENDSSSVYGVLKEWRDRVYNQ